MFRAESLGFRDHRGGGLGDRELILQSPVSLVDGVVAVATLLGLQLGTEFLTTRSESVRKLAEGHPTLLAFRGQLLFDNMRRGQVNEHEILASVRRQGIQSLEDVEAVILEIDGEFTVIPRGKEPPDALRDVHAFT